MALDPARALEPQRSVVVEACAGSGKTWLLSSRITRALLEGVAPRSILALTFTNKAAAEMRHRVIGQLRDLSASDAQRQREILSNWGLTGQALETALLAAPKALQRFLSDPQPPMIGTFHSWYARLIVMAPLRAAGMASLSLTQRASDLHRQAWELFLASHADRLPYAELIELMGPWHVREAMQSWLAARVEWQAFGVESQLQSDAAAVAGRATAGKSVIADALSANRSAVSAFYQAQQSQAAIFAKAYAEIADRAELAGLFSRWNPDELSDLRGRMLTQRTTEEMLSEPDSPRFHLKGGDDRFVRKGKDLAVWGAKGPALKAQIQAFGVALGGLITACDARLLAARNQALWACASTLGQCLEEVMAKSHETDFTGLEMKAWELLGGALAADFHARFDRQISQLLVDEFQDTNPVQWAMLRGWLSQYEQDDHSIAASAPRVFIVGDPKQSIYRFRRADPEVFYAASRWLAQHFGADVLSTNTTYRCGPAVVAFLNAALGSAAPNRFTDHETRATDAVGFVARLSLAPDWESEGRAIAAALLQLRKELPSLQWSEVRILLRARTHFQSYELALTEAGIPFVSDRSGGLLSSPEIEDLIALLRFLAAPWSDRDCAQALKSPIFGLADSQLVAIAKQRAADDAESFYAGLLACGLQPDADPALAAAVESLSRWIDLSTQLPVHDLLDQILHDQDVFDRIASRTPDFRSLQRLANIEAFIGLALELDTGRLPSLPRFLRELHRSAALADSESPGPGVLPNQQAVALSTLHAAKGLEARVVVLAGLMDRGRSESGLRWLSQWSENRDAILGHAGWIAGDPIGPFVRDALLEEDRRTEEEDFNLLYVGITRAKQVLLLSATGEERPASSSRKPTWYEKLKDHCEQRDFVQLPVPGQAAQEGAPALFAPPTVTWRGLRFDQRTNAAGSPAPETLAMRQGKALHRLLEFGPQQATAVARALIAEFGLPCAARDEVIASAAAIGKSELAARIFSPHVLAYSESEWPVVDLPSGALMRPDRVVRIQESPEEWWIVDFKWNVLPSEHADYVRQLALYRDQFARIRPQARVTAKILTAKAQLWDLQGDRLVHLA